MTSTEETAGPEYLISQSTLTCLAVINGTGPHDAVIGMAKCNGSINQQWFAVNGQWQWGGNRSLCLAPDNQFGGLCLASCNTVAGSWIHDQEDRLCFGSQALDVPWQKPRTQVLLYPKHTYANQKWWTLSQLNACLEDNHLVGEHCLTSSILDICKKELDRTSSIKKPRSTERGQKNLKECHCEVANDFMVLSIKGEVIHGDATTAAPEYLVNQSTLTCLTVLSGTGPHDAIIGLSPFTGNTNQQWFVNGGHWQWGGNQSYCLAPDWKNGTLCLAQVGQCKISWTFSHSGLLETMSQALDVPWEEPRKQVIMYPNHGGKNQKWWKLLDVKSTLQRSPELRSDFPEVLVKMAEHIPDKVEGYECQCQAKEDVIDASQDETKDVNSDDPEYLISQSTHTCLSVLSGTGPRDAIIGLAPYTGDVNQQWFVNNGRWQWGSNRSFCLAPDRNSGNLSLVPCNDVQTSWILDKAGLFKNGSNALDVPWEGERTKVILYPKHGGINQKWWMLSTLKSCVGRKMYPFSAKDEKIYQQEVARGIVNKLCPLSEDLPHARDVDNYPGTVPAGTPRTNLSCTLHVGTVRQSRNLRMTTPEDWQATNMYVVAGDIFKVVLPGTLTEDQAKQITVRVGAQSDNLDPRAPNVKNGIFKRMPVISEEFDVHPGVNSFRSQFGGNLIFTYEGEGSFKVKAEVKNIIETPHYILGKTNSSDWKKMKDLDSPFCVLETDKVVLIVPTSKAKCISNPDSLLHKYDDIMKKLENLAGFTKNDPPPQGKQWMVDDVQISAGSAHAGFPAMFDHQLYDLTSPETPNDWVVWHELGHNYQQGPFWSYAYGIESTVNLFSLYIEENLKADDRLKRENYYMPTAEAVDKGLTFEKADCWQKLVFLMEIKHAFPNHGWDMFRQLNRTTRALSEDEASSLKNSLQNQYDYVYKILSRYVGADLILHYQRWSLPISQQAMKEVQYLGLPKAPQNLSAKCHPQQCVMA